MYYKNMHIFVRIFMLILFDPFRTFCPFQSNLRFLNLIVLILMRAAIFFFFYKHNDVTITTRLLKDRRNFLEPVTLFQFNLFQLLKNQS
jgi:hypothetical protein